MQVTSENLKGPACVGIIMDGNRRWAKEKNIAPTQGHVKGYEKLKESLKWMDEAGITCVIFYTFSTENWKRSDEEKDALFSLLKKAFSEISQKDSDFKKNKIRVRFIGEKKRFSEDLQQEMERVEKETRHFDQKTLVFALSYGGRSEIVRAVNSALSQGVDSVTEDMFADLLDTREIPDPDLIIRTGGEVRLSNFLLWQSAYSELFFSKTYWPDFSKEEFNSIIEEYTHRIKRFGK